MTELEQLLRDTNPDNLHWDTQRIWKALVLSPSLEICCALLRGEHVPRNQLDPLWLERIHHEPGQPLRHP